MELYPNALIGFRSWRINEDLTLLPLTDNNVAWEPGINEAICLENIDHPVPSPHCECGLYAWHALEDSHHYWTHEKTISGAVAAKGRIESHHNGFRAAEMQIIALLDDADDQTAKLVSQKYSVPLFRSIREMRDYALSRGSLMPEKLIPADEEEFTQPFSIEQENAHQQLWNNKTEETETMWRLLNRYAIASNTVKHFQLGIGHHPFPYRARQILVAPDDYSDPSYLIYSSYFNGSKCAQCDYIFSSEQMRQQHSSAKAQFDNDPRASYLQEWAYCPRCGAMEEAQFDWIDKRLISNNIVMLKNTPLMKLYNQSSALESLEKAKQLIICEQFFDVWQAWNKGYHSVVGFSPFLGAAQQLEEALSLAEEHDKPLLFVGQANDPESRPWLKHAAVPMLMVEELIAIEHRQ